MRPLRARPLALVMLAAVAVGMTGCGTRSDDRLMVASSPDPDPEATTSPPVEIWAVTPGQDLDDDTLVATGATRPTGIATLLPDGRSEFNQLATAWKGDVLMGYRTDEASRVTAGSPGAEQTTLAETGSQAQLQTVVLRRGVAVVDDESCRLATSVSEAEVVGDGRCQISEDERWVVSWPVRPGPLTIRDLRNDSERTVDDISTISAAALGRDARVLAVEESGDGVRARMLSATDGSTIGTTDTYDAIDIVPATVGATGMVAVAQEGAETVLLWITTDAEVTEVDRGPALLPVSVGSWVSYVRVDADETLDSVREWAPGDDEPEVLVTGRVAAGAATPDTLVLTRTNDTGVTFYRYDHGAAEPEELLTVEGDTSAGATVTRMVTKKKTALALLSIGDRISFVRLDLAGDHSDVPVEGWPFLLLESIDEDGTVLLAGTEATQGIGQQLLVLRPSDDEPTVRAEADATGVNLIHQGIVYFTNVTQEGEVDVREVRAFGSDEPEVLYEGVQLAGATWPELGGATQAVVASRQLLEQAGPASGG